MGLNEFLYFLINFFYLYRLDLKYDRSVDPVTMLWLEYREIGVRLPAEERAQNRSDRLEGHSLWNLEHPSLGSRRPGCEESVEDMNANSCTCTPPYATMAECPIKHGGNATIYRLGLKSSPTNSRNRIHFHI